MKKIIFTLGLAFFTLSNVFAQRFAYVDTDYILDNIPTYTEAQQQLDDLVKTWNDEINVKFNEVKQLYAKYEAEEFLLTDELRKKRQDEIITKERLANELQNQRFGYEGDLFKKRQEFVQPLQEKIYNAIEKIAKNLGFDFVLDKASGGSTLLYTNSKYDLSEQVLKTIQP